MDFSFFFKIFQYYTLITTHWSHCSDAIRFLYWLTGVGPIIQQQGPLMTSCLPTWTFRWIPCGDNAKTSPRGQRFALCNHSNHQETETFVMVSFLVYCSQTKIWACASSTKGSWRVGQLCFWCGRLVNKRHISCNKTLLFPEGLLTSCLAWVAN